MLRTFSPRRPSFAPRGWLRSGAFLRPLFCAWLAMAGVVAVGSVETASAESATRGAATRFVKQKQQELGQTIRSSKDLRSDPKLLAIFDSMLNYERLTQEALKQHWDEMTSEQRVEVSGLLKQLVQNSYRKNLRDPGNYGIEYLGEHAAKGGTLVQTRTTHKKNAREKPLSIDYVVEQVDGRWLVHDVVTDGVSLVRNYRRQFSRIIKKKGIDGLMTQMRKQVDKQSSAT